MAHPINAATLALNGASEACRLMAYDDARPDYVLKAGDKVQGTLTQGWGHTGSDIKIGALWTQEHADAAREADLGKAAKIVTGYVHVPLTDNQFGVLIDFAFNVGPDNFLGSTLLAKLNAGDIASVPDQLARWVYATVNGKKVKQGGLVARRQREAVLWNVPDEKSPDALAAFSPATQPSVSASAIPAKSILSSASTYGIALGGVAIASGPVLQETASQLHQFADVAPMISQIAHWLGITGLVCAMAGKLRDIRQHNNAQAT